MNKGLKKVIAIASCISIIMNTTVPIFGMSKESSNKNIEIEESVDSKKTLDITWTSNDTVDVGAPFDNIEGVKAINEDGEDVTSSITVEGNVDTSKPGKYILKYSGLDKSGKTIVVPRTITIEEPVKDKNKDESLKSKILAPQITQIYLGESFDSKLGVSAVDVNGEDITANVTIEGNVNINEVGSYQLKYSVTDSLGESIISNRTVKVINKNVFNVYTQKVDEVSKETIKELAFSIYLNNETGKFEVINQSPNKLDISSEKEKVFSVRVVDKENKEKLLIELLGEDGGDSEKLNLLKELQYEYGDSIEMYLKDAKNGFNIEGDMLGDINIDIENYVDGVDNLDYINNVRFCITEDGIRSVYNEAPIIHGLDNLEVHEDLSKIDPLIGLKVTDDHDGDIDISKIKVETKSKVNGKIEFTYTIEDSWGRIFTGNRHIFNLEHNKNLLKTTSGDIFINVDGVEYKTGTSSQSGLTERFKIKIDAGSKEIKVIDQDGRIMSNLIKGEYFKFEIFDKDMNSKGLVTLLGTDKSDSEKLKSINNIRYEDGDYISIWHAESDTKLSINGTVENGTDPNYTDGIDEANLINHRFNIISTGINSIKLVDVVNQPPVFGDLAPITISRGQEIDLLKYVENKVTDDYDTGKLKLTHSKFDNSRLGDQTITYTATDKWGLSSKKDITVIVESTNLLENTDIEVLDKNKNVIFKVKFDAIKKEFIIRDVIENSKIDDSTSRIVFRIKLLSHDGAVRRSIDIKGDDNANQIMRNKLDGYKYNIGDRIELWAFEPKNLKIKGSILDIPSGGEDYADGIDHQDNMNNVRFELTDTQLKYIYNQAPVFNNMPEMTVTRGDSNIDFKQDVTITDDYDTNLLDKVTWSNVDINTVGRKIIMYKVNDSWGRITSAFRTINVVPYNQLENNEIKVNNDSDNTIFSVGFDDIKKRLTLKSIDLNHHISTVEGSIFKIYVYDKDNQSKKATLDVLSEDHDNGSLENKINKISYEEGDYLGIWAYSHSGVSIIDKTNSNGSGFNNHDEMVNTNFKITSTGLERVYNNQPSFKGVDRLIVYKGDTLDRTKALDGVVVSDDNDNTIDNSNIIINGLDSIDTNTIGEYSINYLVSDYWGRSTSIERNISVVSRSNINDIDLYDNSGNKLFTLKYDSRSTGFNLIKGVLPTHTPVNPTQEVFRMSIFNRTGENVYSLNLNQEDLLNLSKLEKIENIEVNKGYSFSVWSQEPRNIKISGEFLANSNSNLGDSGNLNEDYSDGIDHIDNMNNVRFKIDDLGIECIYNKAPVLNVTGGDITQNIGYEIDYLTGFSAIDDHDGDISSNYVVTEIDENSGIGTHVVTYTVTDSWGRSSSIARNVVLTNSLTRNELVFKSGRDILHPNTYRDALKIKFDISTKQIKLDRINNDEFLQNSGGNNERYYKIDLKSEDGTSKLPGGEVILNFKDTANSDKLNRLENISFEYGDIIEVWAAHPYKFGIDGKVINAQEDYSDGVQNAEYLKSVKFKITEKGIESIYDDRFISENDRFNIVAPVSREGHPFVLKIDPVTRRISRVEATTDEIQYEDLDNGLGVKLTLFGADGIKKRTLSMNTNMRGNDNKSNALNGDYEYGDYLKIWHKDTSEIIIKGNIINPHENYVDGFKDRDSMDYSVFRLTENGMESIYNEAPNIIGVEEKNIIKSSTFNKLEGISVTDDKDSSLTFVSEGEINTNTLGEQTIRYTSTDNGIFEYTEGSNRVKDSQRTTIVNRKIIVRPKLYENVFKVFSDNNTNTPVFEIGFDSTTNKYNVYNRSQDILSTVHADDDVFKIEIKDSNGNIKKIVILNGNDRGTSEKLDSINEVSYAEGDIVRVYRTNADKISISGSIIGNIPPDLTQEDYMNNTGFEVNNNGLIAIYNNAPTLEGISNKTTLKDTTIDLLDGVNVSDDKDTNISKQNIIVSVNGEISTNKSYTFNRLGRYEITYQISDSWGRTTLKTSFINVESKVKNNEIKMYDNLNNLKYKIKFDTSINKFLVVDSNGAPIVNNLVTEAKIVNNLDIEVIVRDIKGIEKYKVNLNSDFSNAIEELNKINNKDFSRFDTISLKSKNPQNLKIRGNIINSSIDYSNGFGSIDKFSTVRFKITDNGLEEITQLPLEIHGTTDLTIKRGTTNINLLEGVYVTNNDNTNQDYNISVDNSNLDISKEGEYTITYTATSSWGYSISKDRTIIVESRNPLDAMRFRVNNRNGEEVITIGIDTITSKFRVISYTDKVMDSSNPDKTFELNLYNANGEGIGNLSFKGNQRIDENILDRINKTPCYEGFYLGLWSINPKTDMSIKGDIKSNITIFNKLINGIDDIDYMTNGRFKICEDGLEYIYNKAPVIEYGGVEINHYKGEKFVVPENINISDDHDKILNYYDILVDDKNVDFDMLGRHEIVLYAEDSWGRIGSITIPINIKSSLDKSSMDIYDSSNTKVFSILFNNNINNDKTIQIIKNSNVPFDSSNPNDTMMKLNIYNSKQESQVEVVLLGGDTGQSPKLDAINNHIYNYGDYISITNVKASLLNKVKVNGNIINQKEDYTDGVSNSDNLDNIRFKFTDIGLESIYNEKPRIKIVTGIDANKGDSINFMDGINIFDDHDKLSEENIIITGFDEIYNRNEGSSEYTGQISYKAVDKWGRESDIVLRDVVLRNSIPNNELFFKAGGDLSSKNTIVDGFKLKFDISNGHPDKGKFGGRIIVEKPNPSNDLNIDPKLLNTDQTTIRYYDIIIRKKDGTSRTVNLLGNDKASTSKLDVLNNLIFEYGDIIKIWAAHPFKFGINGVVRDAREDYSDCVNNPDNVLNVEFEITEDGIKAINNEPEVEVGKNKIAPVAADGYPFILTVDASRKTITKTTSTGNNIEFGVDPVVKGFEMTLFSSNGVQKGNKISLNTNQDGGAVAQHPFGGSNTNPAYEYGDYLKIWHRTPKMMLIKGDVKNGREDYSDGIDNSDNMNYALFKLTANGIEAVYEDVPEINGVVDRRVEKGSTFTNDDALQGIVALDNGVEIDKTDSSKFKFVNNVDTGRVGLYDVTYTIIGKRSTTRRSTITVFARPTINLKEDKRILELNSIESDSESIKRYLETAVTVQDDEDGTYGPQNKKTKLDINSNFNPSIEGTYPIMYTATDSDGDVTTETVEIQVTRTINVTVPTGNNVPFQVITNLKNKNENPFLAGVLKFQNNNTSPVEVYMKSFRKTDNGDLMIVDPSTVLDWDGLSEEDTMKKMALGLYNKDGLINTTFNKERPLWFNENMNGSGFNPIFVGDIPRARTMSNPMIGTISFVAKHGKKFIGGTSKAKFELVLEFR